VQLAEPPYDPEIWKALGSEEKPTAATAYPTVSVHIGANAKFVEAAPKLAEFLRKYETTGEMPDALHMADRNANAIRRRSIS
jgi:glycine betaine/proline transport system substrate-binding protein